jgi:CDP-diacylglycerol---glycerol-3-phosphate 3-phosphatidyltransferase
MFDGRWRHGVDRRTGPVGQRLVRVGVTADVLTASGLAFAVATAVVVATGHLLIAIPLLAITGFHDLFDGPVAKAAGTASVRGAFFDSVTDRVADTVLMGGVAWYLVSVHEGELVLLPLAVLGAASLVSYVRAKSDALGLPVTNRGVFGGLMERAERMILLGVGFLEPWLLVPVLWVLLGLTLVTAGARFAAAWSAAQGPPPRPSRQLRPTARRREGGHVRSRRARSDGTPSVVSGGRAELTARWRARRQEAMASRSARARSRRERIHAARVRRRVPGGRVLGGHGGRGPGTGSRGD